MQKLLEATGYAVVLTRTDDHRANWQPDSPQPTGYAAQRLDLQRRIDIANDAGASVFVSLHSNGSSDEGQNGVEGWWDSSRSFANESFRLAGLLKDDVLAELAGVGYQASDRGLKDDVCWRTFQGRCFPIFILGGPRESTRAEIIRRGADPANLGLGPDDTMLRSRAAAMPGALIENLFISQPLDAAVLKSEAGRDAIARGVAKAIDQFLGGSS